MNSPERLGYGAPNPIVTKKRTKSAEKIAKKKSHNVKKSSAKATRVYASKNKRHQSAAKRGRKQIRHIHEGGSQLS